MKRALRFTCWVSLLLCIATLGLWVRSYFAVDLVGQAWVFSRSDVRSLMTVGGSIRGGLNFEFRYIHGWLGTVGGPLPERQQRVGRLRSWVLADRDFINRSGGWVAKPLQASSTPPTWVPPWRWDYVPAETTDGSAWTLHVSVPHWFLAVLFATGALPLILFRSRRRNTNSCHACGYNLTGNTSGVCPECGTRRQRARQRLIRSLTFLLPLLDIEFLRAVADPDLVRYDAWRLQP